MPAMSVGSVSMPAVERAARVVVHDHALGARAERGEHRLVPRLGYCRELVTPSGQNPGVVSTAQTLALGSAACIAEMYCSTLAA